ncbi:MAG: hypothetical protein RLY86_125 [Pseudomonadota bacterium]|jgi:phage-related baseplate assembly protein
MSGAVDLSLLPAPQVIEPLDAEQVLADQKAQLAALWPAAANLLDSDPAAKLLTSSTYRELLVRQRVNDAARAVMLPFAGGADLDGLAALVGVSRQVVDPGDPNAIPPRPVVMESDDRLRSRAQGAWEGLSVAGPVGAYVHHARRADPRVSDVQVTSPSPGVVQVYILSPDQTAPQDLLAAVTAAVSADTVRPLTDQVLVSAGEPVPYQVHARLTLYSGPDAAVVRQAAMDRLTTALARQRRLGERVGQDLLYAALRVEGVRVVDLIAPTAAVECGPGQYPSCTSVLVEVA